MMRIGGCAAVTACDSCIYFDKYRGTALYPFDIAQLTRKDYIRFGMRMKPYLAPRWSGIDTLEIYMEGFGRFLSDHGGQAITMQPLYGNHPVAEAKRIVLAQIDKGFPVPCLTLNHANPSYKDFEWHWFMLTGYEQFADSVMVKAVTYGTWHWLDLDGLWDTGYSRKGGLILYS